MRDQKPPDRLFVVHGCDLVLSTICQLTSKAMVHSYAVWNYSSVGLKEPDCRGPHWITDVASLHSLRGLQLGQGCCFKLQGFVGLKILEMHEVRNTLQEIANVRGPWFQVTSGSNFGRITSQVGPEDGQHRNRQIVQQGRHQHVTIPVG